MARVPDPHRRCPSCAAENVAHATFCLECGEPLAEEAPRRVLGGAAPPGAVAPARAWPAKELLLGIGLLLLVVGGGLADWWHGESQAQLYRVGLAAEAARHWDPATTAFGSLGDYRDAPQRHRAALDNFLLRNSNYRVGREALQQHNWLTAYRAYRAVVAVEPDYLDAGALMTLAGQLATQAALTDTIYRLPQGAAPGLYLRRAAGKPDLLLAGSDAVSQVWLADDAGGHVLYDGPPLPGTPPAPSSFSADPLGRFLPRLLPGRRLLLADVNTPSQAPVALPALIARGDYLVLGHTGVWSFVLAGGGGLEPGDAPDTGLAFSLLVYYDFASGAVTPLPAAGADYYLLDADTANGRLVIGRYDWQDSGTPQTTLYLLGDGGAQQPLVQVTGFCKAARISPDGQQVLYTVSTALGGVPPSLDLVLLDLRAPVRQPQVLRSLDLSVDGNSSATRLRGEFVPGSDPPRVLIQEAQYGDTRLLLHNLADGTDTGLYELSSPTALAGLWFAADGRTLFLNERYGPDSTRLVLQHLDGAYTAVALPLPPTPPVGNTSVLAAVLQGDQVVYETLDDLANTAGQDTGGQAIYSASVQKPAAQSILLGMQAVRVSDVLRGGSPQLLLLPAGLVLTTDASGALRLRTPDGGVDLPAVPGADALWLYRPPPSLLRF